MDIKNPRRLDRIDNRAVAGAEPEEAEEEGQWEGRERTTTKGHCTGRGDDDCNYYAPPHPDYEAAAASIDSNLAIPFAFGPRYVGSPLRSRG